MKCPFCGAENTENEGVCTYCGSRLPQKFEGEQTKYCHFCGNKIPLNAVICVYCGRQIEELKGQAVQTSQQPVVPQVIIYNNDKPNGGQTNNTMTTNYNTVMQPQKVNHGKAKNKWVSLLLCLFLGFFGGHKFYEGKTGMGLLYLFTAGLCCIGPIVDFFVILFKPNPYYV